MAPEPVDSSPFDLPVTAIGHLELRTAATDIKKCHELRLEGAAGDWVTIECLNRLGGQFREMSLQTKKYERYVGVHTVSLLPIFTTGGAFLQRPTSKACAAKDIIFDEQILRREPTSAGQVKKDLTERIDAGAGGAQKRRKRFPAVPEPDSNVRISTAWTPTRLPLRLRNIEEYGRREFFSLSVPCLGSTSVPEALVSLARDIHASLPQDNLHLHVVLMAVIVWVDIHFDASQKGLSLFVKQKLINFIAHWPHYLRFHEVFHLSVYSHPCHFVEAVWRNSVLEVPENSAWEDDAERLVDLCRLHPRTDYVQMLPSSWPGSTLTFPADGEFYGFAVSDAALAKRLGLPSIHAIGHPAYPTDQSSVIPLLIPRTWVSPAITNVRAYTSNKVSSQVMKPAGLEDKDGLRLITGQVLEIFPRPEDLKPLTVIQSQVPDHSPDRPAQRQHSSDTLRVFWESVASPAFRQAQKDAQNSKLEEAKAAGITLDQIAFDDYNLLSWPTTPAEASPPQHLSAELATQLRNAVEKHLATPHHHQKFQDIIELAQAGGELELTSTQSALKCAVDVAQLNKEKMITFIRHFRCMSFVNNDPADWTFCKAIAPDFLIPLLHLVGAHSMAAQPLEMFTPEWVGLEVKGISDVHAIISCLLAPGTVVCAPTSRVLLDACLPMTKHWMNSLMETSPFQTLDVFQKLLDSMSQDTV